MGLSACAFHSTLVLILCINDNPDTDGNLAHQRKRVGSTCHQRKVDSFKWPARKSKLLLAFLERSRGRILLDSGIKDPDWPPIITSIVPSRSSSESKEPQPNVRHISHLRESHVRHVRMVFTRKNLTPPSVGIFHSLRFFHRTAMWRTHRCLPPSRHRQDAIQMQVANFGGRPVLNQHARNNPLY